VKHAKNLFKMIACLLFLIIVGSLKSPNLNPINRVCYRGYDESNVGFPYLKPERKTTL